MQHVESERRHRGGSGRAQHVLVAACAISAGVHAALAPAHLAEGVAAGAGFALSAALLAALAGRLALQQTRASVAAAAAVLAGLLASYALAVTSGLPLLHPDVEPVDGLAAATKAVEALGLLAALRLLRPGRPGPAATHLATKGHLA